MTKPPKQPLTPQEQMLEYLASIDKVARDFHLLAKVLVVLFFLGVIFGTFRILWN